MTSLGEKAIDRAPTQDDDYAECDYDTDVTPLYQAIEDKAWFAVNQFLHSGYWPDSLFPDPISPREQSRTWVTRYETRRDGSKKVRWSQLPIHAAIIFGAPSVVVQKLVEHFPSGVRCTDDHKMLPLHLAFRHGAPDSILAMLLEAFPGAINCKGHKGRTPVEFAEESPNPQRALIIRTIITRNKSTWEKKRVGQHLNELYHIKEALQNKTRKVSNLEQTISEIRGREKIVEKELVTTKHDLNKLVSGNKSLPNEPRSKEKEQEERRAIEELMRKLTALEMTTQDLLEKEAKTESELKIAIGDLENLKNMKPSDEQAECYEQLRMVESRETEASVSVSSAKKKTACGNDMEASPVVYESRKVVPSKNDENFLQTVLNSIEKEASHTKDELQKAMTEYNQLRVINSMEKQASQTKDELQKAMTDYNHIHLMKSEDVSKLSSLQSVDSEAKAASSVDSNTLRKTASASPSTDSHEVKKIASATLAMSVDPSVDGNASKKIAPVASAASAEPSVDNIPVKKDATSASIEPSISEDFKKDTVQESNNKSKGKLFKFFKKKTPNADWTVDEESKTVDTPAVKNTNQETVNDNTLSEDLVGFFTAPFALHKDKASRGGELKIHESFKVAVPSSDKATAAPATEEENTSNGGKVVGSIEGKPEKSDSTPAFDAALSYTSSGEDVHMKIAMKQLEKISSETRTDLEKAMKELTDLKATKDCATKEDRAALKELKKKVESMQSAMSSMEVKESKTMKALDKTMKELQKLSIKRINLLEKTAEKKRSKDGKEIAEKLEKEASEQHRKIAELEAALSELAAAGDTTKKELDRTKDELSDLHKQQLEKAKDAPQIDLSHEQRAIKELNKKVLSLQQAVVGFEVKETKTMREMEKTMKHLEELTSQRFQVLTESKTAKDVPEAAKLLKQTEKINGRASALLEEIGSLEENMMKTRQELTVAKGQIEELHTRQEMGWKQFDELNAKQQELLHEKRKQIDELKAQQQELMDEKKRQLQEFDAEQELRLKQFDELNKKLDEKHKMSWKQYEEFSEKQKEQERLQKQFEEFSQKQKAMLDEGEKQIAKMSKTFKDGDRGLIDNLAENVTELQSSVQKFEEQEGQLKQLNEAITQMEVQHKELLSSKQNDLNEMRESLMKDIKLKQEGLTQTLSQSRGNVPTADMSMVDKLAKQVADLEATVQGFQTNKKIEDLNQTVKDMEEKQRELIIAKQEELYASQDQLKEELRTKQEELKKQVMEWQSEMPDVSGLKQQITNLQLAMAEINAKEQPASIVSPTNGSDGLEELKEAMKQMEEKQKELMHARQEELSANQEAFRKELEAKQQEISNEVSNWKFMQNGGQKLIDDLTRQVSTLQTAVMSFETKETQNAQQMNQAIKQMEDMAASKFAALEQQATRISLTNTGLPTVSEDVMTEETMMDKMEKMMQMKWQAFENSMPSLTGVNAAKITALESALRQLEGKATLTSAELESTKFQLEQLKANSPEHEIAELNKKIAKVQGDVLNFELQETSTMKELEITMKQLEELTAKRVHVLENVQGQKESLKMSEITKLQKKQDLEELKVVNLESEMKELKESAQSTKEELQKTTKALEEIQAKQATNKLRASVDAMEDKRAIKELTQKVTDLQLVVQNFEESESKTNADLEFTKKTLEHTAKELEELKSNNDLEKTRIELEELKQKQIDLLEEAKNAVIPQEGESVKVSLDKSKSAGEDFSVEVEVQDDASKKSNAEQNLSNLENAIIGLMDKLNSVEVVGSMEMDEDAPIPNKVPTMDSAANSNFAAGSNVGSTMEVEGTTREITEAQKEQNSDDRSVKSRESKAMTDAIAARLADSVIEKISLQLSKSKDEEDKVTKKRDDNDIFKKAKEGHEKETETDNKETDKDTEDEAEDENDEKETADGEAEEKETDEKETDEQDEEDDEEGNIEEVEEEEGADEKVKAKEDNKESENAEDDVEEEKVSKNSKKEQSKNKKKSGFFSFLRRGKSDNKDKGKKEDKKKVDKEKKKEDKKKEDKEKKKEDKEKKISKKNKSKSTKKKTSTKKPSSPKKKKATETATKKKQSKKTAKKTETESKKSVSETKETISSPTAAAEKTTNATPEETVKKSPSIVEESNEQIQIPSPVADSDKAESIGELEVGETEGVGGIDGIDGIDGFIDEFVEEAMSALRQSRSKDIVATNTFGDGFEVL